MSIKDVLKPLISTVDKRRFTLVVFLVVTLSYVLFMPINPWPHDYWYQTHLSLFVVSPGADNYTPISLPAYISSWQIETNNPRIMLPYIPFIAVMLAIIVNNIVTTLKEEKD